MTAQNDNVDVRIREADARIEASQGRMHAAAKTCMAHALSQMHDVGAPPAVIFMAALDALLEYGARQAPQLAEAAILNRVGQGGDDAG